MGDLSSDFSAKLPTASSAAKGIKFLEVFSVGASQSGMSQNVFADISGSSIVNIPAGTYLVTWGIRGRVDYTAGNQPSSVEINFQVRSSTDTILASTACGAPMTNATRHSACVISYAQVVLGSTTTVKLTASIASVGGSGLSYNTENGFIVFKKIS